MHDFLDWSIHQSAVKNGRIMASATPFGRLGANGVLHVFNTFAVPLIIEGRKMMHRTEPLVVNILMAAFAGIRFHKELAGNFFSAINLRGAGEKVSLRAVAFVVHGS